MILDDLSSSYKWNIPKENNISFIRGSITNECVLKKAFSREPMYVFHLAAHFANQNSVDHPEKDLDVNGMGTLRILEYCVKYKVKRVVYASSGCSIYGHSPLPLKEEYMSLDLSSPYQITKMLGELYCNYFQHHYGIQCVKTRFFNSYGPGEVPGKYRNVIPNFFYWAMKGKSLPITGSGEETRDFTYVGDITEGMIRSAVSDKTPGEAINLASGKEIKIVDLANMINKMTGNLAGINFIERRKWDTKLRILASIEKAKSLIDYEPSVNFMEGLKKTHNWFKANWDEIKKSADF